MTKAAVAKSWSLYEWSDGTKRSWPEPSEPEEPEDDWLARSTGAGVVAAFEFTEELVGDGEFANGNDPVGLANVHFNYVGGVRGRGCLRINYPSISDSDPGAWRFEFPKFWDGSVNTERFFIQFRFKPMCRYLARHLAEGDGGKIAIISNYDHSNTSYEIVPWNPFYNDVIQVYRPGGVPISPDPDPAFELRANEWTTLMFELRAASYGSAHANNVFRVWAAHQGDENWTVLYDQTNVNYFGDDSDEGFSGIWLTPYDTGAEANEAPNTGIDYDQVILSTEEIPIPQDLPATPLPEWVPDPGEAAAISLNTMQDVDPAPTKDLGSPWSGLEGQDGVLDDWNGGAFAETLGKYGSLLLFGGGHNGYFGNEVYRFDLETQLWSRLSDPSSNFSSIDYDNGEVSPGVPLSSHTYCQVHWIPGYIYGNEHGAFARTVSTYQHDKGGEANGSSGRSHAFNLDTNEWERLSNNLAELYMDTIAAGVSCYVPPVGNHPACIYFVTQGFVPIQRLRLDTKEWEAVTEDDYFLDQDTVADFCPQHALAVFVENGDSLNGPQICAIDCRNPQNGLQGLSISGTGPTDTAIGFKWAPSLGCFVAWEGRTSNRKLFYLRPPVTNPLSNDWTWTSETLDGTSPPAPRTANGCYSKAQWADKIRSLITVTRVDEDVWAFRPSDAKDD